MQARPVCDSEYVPGTPRPMRGTIRERKDGRIYLDFWPDVKGSGRFLWSDNGRAFMDKEHARRVGEDIHRLQRQDKTLEEAISGFRQAKSRPNRVTVKMAEHMERLEEENELEHNTLVGYRSVVNQYAELWGDLCMHEVSYSTLEVWRNGIRAKGRGGKTAKNAFAFFRGFLKDYRRRNPKYVIPEFPRVKVEAPEKPRMPLGNLVRVLDHIPEEKRGIFLCLAYTTIRVSEARALSVKHYDWKERVLDVRVAMKTDSGINPVIGPTKTGSTGKYPAADDLHRWLVQNTPDSHRFEPDTPLFMHPHTKAFWRGKTVTHTWEEACEAAEVEYVPVYAATKRSGLTALSEAGISIEDVQAMGRHSDAKMTREYVVEDDQKRRRATEALADMIEREKGR